MVVKKEGSANYDGNDVGRCQRLGAAVLQPHKQDGVVNVAVKSMPRIITEENVQAFDI